MQYHTGNSDSLRTCCWEPHVQVHLYVRESQKERERAIRSEKDQDNSRARERESKCVHLPAFQTKQYIHTHTLHTVTTYMNKTTLLSIPPSLLLPPLPSLSFARHASALDSDFSYIFHTRAVEADAGLQKCVVCCARACVRTIALVLFISLARARARSLSLARALARSRSLSLTSVCARVSSLRQLEEGGSRCT